MKFWMVAIIVGVLFGTAFLVGGAEAGAQGPVPLAQVSGSQTQPVGTTPTMALIDSVDTAQGVDVIGNEVFVAEDGCYMVVFAPQVGKDTGGPRDFQAWIRIDGVDVPNSNVLLRLDNNTKDVIISQGISCVPADSAFSFWTQASGYGVYMEAIDVAPNPLVPAHISTVYKVD